MSCLKAETFHNSNLESKFQSNPFKNLKTANGSGLKIIGKVEIPIEIDNKIVKHPFFVIDNLNENCILGIDFITKHKLNYCPQTRTFYWPGDKPWSKGVIKTTKAHNIPALSTKVIKVNVITDTDSIPAKNTVVGACIGSEMQPLLTSDPGLSTVNEHGQMSVLVKNCAPIDIVLDLSLIHI